MCDGALYCISDSRIPPRTGLSLLLRSGITKEPKEREPRGARARLPPTLSALSLGTPVSVSADDAEPVGARRTAVSPDECQVAHAGPARRGI